MTRWRARFNMIATAAAQVVLTMFFTGTGYGKLTAPVPHLALLMTWPSMAPEEVVRGLGLAEFAIGCGLSLNLLFIVRLRALPRFCALAILWSAAAFTLFHLIAGPRILIALNLLLMALALLVARAYGRRASASAWTRG